MAILDIDVGHNDGNGRKAGKYADVDFADLYGRIDVFICLGNELPYNPVFEQKDGKNQRNEDNAGENCQVKKYFLVFQGEKMVIQK